MFNLLSLVIVTEPISYIIQGSFIYSSSASLWKLQHKYSLFKFTQTATSCE